MKRTIEVDDCIPSKTSTGEELLRALLVKWIAENPVEDEAPNIGDLDYNGDVSSMVDSLVPEYTTQIDTAFFLYKQEIYDAHSNAGVGDSPLENNGMAGLYWLFWDRLCEWYSVNADEIFTENHKEEDDG